MEGVRRADDGDLERCCELVAAAIGESEGRRGGDMLLGGEPEARQPRVMIDRWMADPEAELLVGTFSEAIVGVGAGRVVVSGPKRVGQVECFYVEPGARAVGVGHAIVKSLVEFFGRRGCSDVDAVALPGDRLSKQLLESSGFKARLLVLHRSLD